MCVVTKDTCRGYLNCFCGTELKFHIIDNQSQILSLQYLLSNNLSWSVLSWNVGENNTLQRKRKHMFIPSVLETVQTSSINILAPRLYDDPDYLTRLLDHGRHDVGRSPLHHPQHHRHEVHQRRRQGSGKELSFYFWICSYRQILLENLKRNE